MRQFKSPFIQKGTSWIKVLGLVCFFTILVSHTNTRASTTKNNQVSFDAEAILPKNQQSKASYFDLRVRAGSSEKLTIKLRNITNQKQRIIIETNNAITNQNGAIDYSKSKAQLLGTPSFKAMVSGPHSVILKPKEVRKVEFPLKIPTKGFKGTVLGGFYCYSKPLKNSPKEQGVSLLNNFAYTIGAKLECTNEVIHSKLTLKKVFPGLANGYLTVFATLENPQPVLLSRLDMRATVTKKGQSAVLKQVTKKISIAPRTRFRLPIDWDNEPLKSGRYVLTIHLKSPAGEKWLLKKEFSIKGDAEKLNKSAVEVKKPADNSLIYLMMDFLVMVILILGVYIYRLKHKNKKTEK